jgi:uncharacterized membrane protein
VTASLADNLRHQTADDTRRADPAPDAWRRRTVALVMGLGALLFGLASLRHGLHMSGAYDLTCFDQPLFLLSQGLPPLSSVMGVHLLGDHAAWSLWPTAILYRLWPSPHVLLLLQAAALALGAWTAWLLARQAGCDGRRAFTLAAAYAAFPLVFNANLFDFHPDAFVPAALMGALVAARGGRWGWFVGLCLLAAGCKEVFGLTVAGLGVYLVWAERRRAMGLAAVGLGLGAFAAAVGWIVPAFSGGAPAAISRYGYLGASATEIARHVVLEPGRWFGHVVSGEIALYLLYLFVPLAWALRGRHLAPLVAAVPAIGLNVLADYPAQHDVVHHYALPALPFLVAAAAGALAAGETWLKGGRAIAAWTAVAFLALAKPGYFGGLYLQHLDNLAARNEALRRVPASVGVLTTHELAPHLAHRTLVRFTDKGAPPTDLGAFGAILLDSRHPGWRSDTAFTAELAARATADGRFQSVYARDGVTLLVRRGAAR